MKSKSLFMAFAFLYALGTAAQTNKEAKGLLNDVRKTTEGYKNQTILFTNEIDAPTGKADNPRSKRVTKGKAQVKGNKYRIDMGDYLAIYDGKQTFMVYPDDNEINIVDAKENQINLTPSSILSAYEKGYSYAMAGKETVAGKNIQYIRLKPVATADVKEILIGIDTKKKQLYSYQQFGQNGVNTKLTVTSYDTTTQLSENLFSLKAPEFSGFDVIKE
jgi:outer membrane lipoprotein-sorting protein